MKKKTRFSCVLVDENMRLGYSFQINLKLNLNKFTGYATAYVIYCTKYWLDIQAI